MINTMGFGASVISRLLQTSIKKNLFYTIKDKVIEERVVGSAIHKRTQKTKVYGSDSTKAERESLMEILRERVEYHKDKIISPIIYEELCGLEVKKNGKIEHSSNTHDDQVFSWLWGLWIYYQGADLMENWGIQRRVLRTDADLEEAVMDIKEDSLNINSEIDAIENEEAQVQEQLDIIEKAPGKKTYEEWMKEEARKDEECLNRLLANKSIRASLGEKYALMKEREETTVETIPTEVFDNFYKSDEELNNYSVVQGNMSSMWR